MFLLLSSVLLLLPPLALLFRYATISGSDCLFLSCSGGFLPNCCLAFPQLAPDAFPYCHHPSAPSPGVFALETQKFLNGVHFPLLAGQETHRPNPKQVHEPTSPGTKRKTSWI